MMRENTCFASIIAQISRQILVSLRAKFETCEGDEVGSGRHPNLHRESAILPNILKSIRNLFLSSPDRAMYGVKIRKGGEDTKRGCAPVPFFSLLIFPFPNRESGYRCSIVAW